MVWKQKEFVSIHAPVGGATRLERIERHEQHVSIHAPVRGATAYHRRVLYSNVVSIHAPVGRDRFRSPAPANRYAFQSTRPWGARLRSRLRRGAMARFNPRARGGRDTEHRTYRDCARPFQSTRPWGARPFRRAIQTAMTAVSIHAPVGGATSQGKRDHGQELGFNPRARGGRDSHRAVLDSRYSSFQSTRPWGARRLYRWDNSAGKRFQSTRPWGARPRELVFVRRYPVFQSTRPWGARRGFADGQLR